MSKLLQAYEELKKSGNFKNTLSNAYIKAFEEKDKDVPIADKISFLYKASVTGADPLMGDITFLVTRSNYFDQRSGQEVKKVTAREQFSYHFFMRKAMEGGGVDNLEVDCEAKSVFSPLKRKNETQLVATARLRKKGCEGEFVYVARWEEFVALVKKGGQWQVNHAWAKRPCLMLEKCAIANVMKRAFPERMQGIDLNEEGLQNGDGNSVKVPEKKEQGKAAPPVDKAREKELREIDMKINSLNSSSRSRIEVEFNSIFDELSKGVDVAVKEKFCDKFFNFRLGEIEKTESKHLIKTIERMLLGREAIVKNADRNAVKIRRQKKRTGT